MQSEAEVIQKFSMRYNFQFRDVFAAGDALIQGLLFTLGLTFSTVMLGFTLGLGIATTAVYGHPWAKRVAQSFVEVIRNTPLLVQLFVIFFGLPSIGLKLHVLTVCVFALAVNSAAYTAEIIRGGIQSIPQQQVEAGFSLGLTGPEVFFHVVLVPALKKVYPSLSSQFVLMMLATSVVSQISAEELFYAGSIIQSRTFRDFEVYIVIALIYLALSLFLRSLFAGLYRLLFRFP